MSTRKKNAELMLFGIYTAALLIQNILAIKTVDVWVFTLTTGVLVSPLVFIAHDVESEVFGYKQTAKMIWLAYVMSFIFTALVNIAIVLPPSVSFAGQEAFANTFATTARISFASFLAYIAGSLANAKIMTVGKERHGLFFRAMASTVVGQLLDNAIFVFAAFLGALPMSALVMMIAGATVWEILYEVLLFPLTKRTIKVIQAL